MISETDPLLEEIVELADALYIPNEPCEDEPGDDEYYAEIEAEAAAEDNYWLTKLP